jgi:hypothetical protein
MLQVGATGIEEEEEYTYTAVPFPNQILNEILHFLIMRTASQPHLKRSDNPNQIRRKLKLQNV